MQKPPVTSSVFCRLFRGARQVSSQITNSPLGFGLELLALVFNSHKIQPQNRERCPGFFHLHTLDIHVVQHFHKQHPLASRSIQNHLSGVTHRYPHAPRHFHALRNTQKRREIARR